MKTKIVFVLMFLLIGMPFALAQSNETTEIRGGKEYNGLERALDRIKLVFAFQIERKAALIEKIEQRRAEHYDFLIAAGKTEQAAKFNATTTGLERNFDQWKANKEDIISRTENRSINKTRDMNQTDKEKRNESREPKGPKVNRTHEDSDDENETEDDMNETDDD